jgi:hypothetical protein
MRGFRVALPTIGREHEFSTNRHGDLSLSIRFFRDAHDRFRKKTFNELSDVSNMNLGGDDLDMETS